MTTSTTEHSVVDVLRAARERISDPERWTTGYYARNAYGDEVVANSPAACQWCAVGAVLAETDLDLGLSLHLSPLAKAAKEYLDRAGPVLDVNDDRGHAATLELYEQAIELAEAEQS
jgi:hypothetical protein